MKQFSFWLILSEKLVYEKFRVNAKAQIIL